MPGRQQDDLGPIGGLGPDRVHLGGQGRPSGPQVEAREGVQGLAQGDRVGGHERRQLVEDARDLLLLGDLGLTQALPSSTATSGSMNSVWPLPDASWTMPLTRARASALTGPVAAVAQGDDRLLEVAAELRPDQRIEAAAQSVVGHPDARAQATQPR